MYNKQFKKFYYELLKSIQKTKEYKSLIALGLEFDDCFNQMYIYKNTEIKRNEYHFSMWFKSKIRKSTSYIKYNIEYNAITGYYESPDKYATEYKFKHKKIPNNVKNYFIKIFRKLYKIYLEHLLTTRDMKFINKTPIKKLPLYINRKWSHQFAKMLFLDRLKTGTTTMEAEIEVV